MADGTFGTLAVVGAGNMGSGIAQKMATEGFDVVLVDVDDEKVARGIGIIDRTLKEAVDRGIMNAGRIASIRDRGAYLTPMQKRVQRYICRFADCVLVNAEAVKNWLISQGYSSEKIVVIPNGVDLSRFAERPDPDRLRAELGLPAATPLVGSVGRISKVKGLEHFLEAAAMLAPRFPDARFLVVGQANADEQLEVADADRPGAKRDRQEVQPRR